jgi:hypothetical protein
LENLKGLDQFGSLGIDTKVILRWVLRETYELNCTGSGNGPIMDFCDEGKKPLFFYNSIMLVE